MDTKNGFIERKPPWIRTDGILDKNVLEFKSKISGYGLKTVCHEARCPNRGECWSHKSVTFILLGNKCTRNCPFCNIETLPPEIVDDDEPQRISAFIKDNNLNHVVLTSVTRDDLQDGGAGHFIKTIRAVRAVNESIPIELLIPDFGGFSYFDEVIAETPDIIGHNIETVERLYPSARPKFSYKRCLEIIRHLKDNSNGSLIKSAILVGLGEMEGEIKKTMSELRESGCGIIYVGQYLAPSKNHYPVKKYYHPSEFKLMEEFALSLGFSSVLCGPLVRSSYKSW